MPGLWSAAVKVPVSGDFENGFGEAPETCAETVRLAAEAGLAGISIEDTALPGAGPYAFDLAVERIRAAAAAARALPRRFRAGRPRRRHIAGQLRARRGHRPAAAFDAAGADCLYVPLPKSMADQERVDRRHRQAGERADRRRLCRADRSPSMPAWARRGCRWVGSLARATQRVILDAGRAMFGDGSFAPLTRSAPGAEIDRLMDLGARR